MLADGIASAVAIASVEIVKNTPSRPVALGEVCAQGRGGEYLIAPASTPERREAAVVSPEIRTRLRGTGSGWRDTTGAPEGKGAARGAADERGPHDHEQ
jgi:hypothetical protein